MSNKLIAGLISLALLLGGSTAMAQSSTAAGGDKAVNENLKLNEDIKLLRKNVRSEKSKIVLQALNLDSDQTAKFLPIYKQYDAELTKLNDLRVANIQEYAKNYGSMSDNKADELVNHMAAQLQHPAAAELREFPPAVGLRRVVKRVHRRAHE